jgi:pSer/pThr/pTyr-binding forkhead associated (FHA) protein
MKLSLIVAQGAKEGTAIPIGVPQFVIGRDPGCQLRPASESVSKRHCALLVKTGKVFARDLGSRNGTFVNDRQIDTEVELHNGDRLKIGPLEFVVRLEIKVKKPADRPRGPLADDDIADLLLESTGPTSNAGPPSDKISAMLLDIPDEPRSPTADEDGVPTGSTQMELPAMTDTAKENTGDKKADKPSGDTASAAKAILEKYARRNRR